MLVIYRLWWLVILVDAFFFTPVLLVISHAGILFFTRVSVSLENNLKWQTLNPKTEKLYDQRVVIRGALATPM